jgi:OmpA family
MKKVLLIALMLCGIARAQEVTVYFDFDSHALTPATTATLNSAFSNLKYYQSPNIEIQGFTDDTGSSGYNDTLALKRARAVEAYLKQVNPTLVTQVDSKRLSAWPEGTTDAQKRQVSIKLKSVLVCGYQEVYTQTTSTPTGIRVTAANFYGENRPLPSVTTSITAEEMLANERFGLDTDGNIIKSWGMLDIKGQSDDGYYTVEVPYDGEPDPDITLWLPGEEDSNTVRWKNTGNEVRIDRKKKCYVLRVPVSATGNTRCNLDKRVNYATTRRGSVRYKTVYVTMDKAYSFYNVKIGYPKGGVAFSARVNDSVYAFTVPYKNVTRGMTFYGWENGEEKPFTFRLARCKMTQDDDKNVYYAMTDKTLQDPIKRKTGFWAWLSRQFS